MAVQGQKCWGIFLAVPSEIHKTIQRSLDSCFLGYGMATAIFVASDAIWFIQGVRSHCRWVNLSEENGRCQLSSEQQGSSVFWGF